MRNLNNMTAIGSPVGTGSSGGSPVTVDNTLTKAGAAADAQKVGKELSELSLQVGEKVDKEEGKGLSAVTDATVTDGKLNILKEDGTTIAFEGGGGSGTNEELVREINNLKHDNEILKSMLSVKDEDNNGIPDGEDRIITIENNITALQQGIDEEEAQRLVDSVFGA